MRHADHTLHNHLQTKSIQKSKPIVLQIFGKCSPFQHFVPIKFFIFVFQGLELLKIFLRIDLVVLGLTVRAARVMGVATGAVIMGVALVRVHFFGFFIIFYIYFNIMYDMG